MSKNHKLFKLSTTFLFSTAVITPVIACTETISPDQEAINNVTKEEVYSLINQQYPNKNTTPSNFQLKSTWDNKNLTVYTEAQVKIDYEVFPSDNTGVLSFWVNCLSKNGTTATNDEFGNKYNGEITDFKSIYQWLEDNILNQAFVTTSFENQITQYLQNQTPTKTKKDILASELKNDTNWPDFFRLDFGTYLVNGISIDMVGQVIFDKEKITVNDTVGTLSYFNNSFLEVRIGTLNLPASFWESFEGIISGFKTS